MRSTKILFVVEVLVIATIFHLDYIGLLPFSKTPFLFLLGWISVRWRGLRWKDVGLSVQQPLLRFIAIGLVVGVAMEALELFATQPLLIRLLNKAPDLHEFQQLVGNTKLLILAIVLAWVLAAFGEETVWRGYLLNRCADLFGRWVTGWILSSSLVTLLFGFAHFPQGPTGIIENIIDGAI